MADGSDGDLYQQEHQLRARAGQVMADLKARGEDWQAAWKAHPVAIAYRELLKKAWTVKHQPGPDPRYQYREYQGPDQETR